MDEIRGLLLIDKPMGWTSFDVVAKVRGVLRREIGFKIKVGHSGTLDPMATGLLILAIGGATKQIDSLMKLPKIYEAEVTLGARSDTDDAEGRITPVSSDIDISTTRIDQAIAKFQGEIEQIPPQFSAIKVDGQRAYKQARKGKPVSLKSRTVQVAIDKVEYDKPKLKFVATVSSGTYIRSLARDIGDELGCGAYLSKLRRTTIGDFSVQEAIGMDNLSSKFIRQHLKKA